MVFCDQGHDAGVAPLTGPAAELLGTETTVDLTAALDQRKAAIDGRLASDAAAGVSGGSIWARTGTRDCGWR